ncbi:putative GTP-binding protein [Paratrimastix pyriformis]|uniref:GTP-binding protein n=1 Tax=Paratrimastix pyriformis TaxID=342808 RepID=A0ABQ8US21_9EUKA|nr:putative GTP-binding protein [Paratrimastix pyriformis]
MEVLLARTLTTGTLPLEYVGLSSLPESFSTVLVTQADLRFNYFPNFPTALFGPAFSSLKTLFMMYCQLEELPPEIASFCSMTALFLHSNKLAALPPELSRLTNLTYLGLGRNRFFQNPETLAPISGLVALQALNLEGNKLPTIEAIDFSRLPSLRSLTLQGNLLTALPDSLRCCTQLELITASNNRIAALPSWIGSLPRLRALHLDRNRLGQLPDTMCAAGALAELALLRLDENQLRALPESFFAPTRLTAAGQVAPGSLPRLRVLDLEGNQLTRVDIPPDGPGTRSMPLLCALMLRRNPLAPQAPASSWPPGRAHLTVLHDAGPPHAAACRSPSVPSPLAAVPVPAPAKLAPAAGAVRQPGCLCLPGHLLNSRGWARATSLRPALGTDPLSDITQKDIPVYVVPVMRQETSQSCGYHALKNAHYLQALCQMPLSSPLEEAALLAAAEALRDTGAYMRLAIPWLGRILRSPRCFTPGTGARQWDAVLIKEMCMDRSYLAELYPDAQPGSDLGSPSGEAPVPAIPGLVCVPELASMHRDSMSPDVVLALDEICTAFAGLPPDQSACIPLVVGAFPSHWVALVAVKQAGRTEFFYADSSTRYPDWPAGHGTVTTCADSDLCEALGDIPPKQSPRVERAWVSAPELEALCCTPLHDLAACLLGRASFAQLCALRVVQEHVRQSDMLLYDYSRWAPVMPAEWTRHAGGLYDPTCIDAVIRRLRAVRPAVRRDMADTWAQVASLEGVVSSLEFLGCMPEVNLADRWRAPVRCLAEWVEDIRTLHDPDLDARLDAVLANAGQAWAMAIGHVEEESRN